MSELPRLPAKRRLVVHSTQDLVALQLPTAGSLDIPLISPTTDRVDLVAWCADNRERLNELRRRHGAIALRGFRVGDADGLRRLVLAMGDEPMAYLERSSPRMRVGEDVYTSTEYAASQAIRMHCENSYASHWPRHIAFYCRTPADAGGATPIADCRRVLAALDPAIVAEFRARGVRYIRNFHPELGLSWREVFAVDTREQAEARCRATQSGFEWSHDGVLRTWRNAPAVVLHPHTREPTWFNHAAFFHVSSLPQEIASGLLQRHEYLALPNHTYYGDGGVIDDATVAAINRAYDDNALGFDWRREDVVLLDNMLYSHGRARYSGPRSVLVSMSDRIAASAVEPG